MKKIFLLLMFLITSITSNIVCQVRVNNKSIDEIVKPFVDHHMFSGSVLIAKDGKAIYSKGFGYANNEWAINNTPDTKFIIGSITKSITSVLIMKLVEENILTLNDKISKYLPQFPKEKGDVITIRHLLSNTSGLPNYFKMDGWTTGKYRRDISEEEFIQEILKLELQSKPGEKYNYSNAGFYLLGIIIQKITNKSYEQVLQDYIFNPLNMSNSGVALNFNIIKNMASGYKVSNKGGYRTQPYFNMELFKAGGNIYSTTEDLLKLDQAIHSNTFLSKDSRKGLFDQENNYPWEISNIILNESDEPYNTIGFSGKIEGYSSILTRIINDDFTIIILSNNGIGYATKKYFVKQISKVLYEKEVANTKLPLTFLLTKELFNGNITKGIEKFNKSNNQYLINEDMLTELANNLLWSGEKSDAIKIYKLTADNLPNSVNANFRIAELLKNNNQFEQAIPYYKRVQTVLPDNEYINGILDGGKK